MHFPSLTLTLALPLLSLLSPTLASPLTSTDTLSLVTRENDKSGIQYLGSQGGTLSGGTRFGNLVFVSGQVPLLANGTVVPGGIKNETAYVIDRVGAILKEGGTDWSKVLKATVLLQGTSGRFVSFLFLGVSVRVSSGSIPSKAIVTRGGADRSEREKIE